MSFFSQSYTPSSLTRGSTSHKAVREDQSWFLKLYYENRYVLAFLCFGNEGFFVFLYVLRWWAGPMIPVTSFVANLFGFTGYSIPLVHCFIWFFFFPIMAVKQTMNVIQLYQAVVDIVELDERERLKAKQK